MSQVLRPALGGNWMWAWRPSWGRATWPQCTRCCTWKASVYRHAFCKPKGPQIAPSSLWIVYVESHAWHTGLTAQVGAWRSPPQGEAPSGEVPTGPREAPVPAARVQGWRRRRGAGLGCGEMTSPSPRAPRAARPGNGSSAAPESSSMSPPLPAPARPVSSSLRSPGGGRLARSLPRGGSGTCGAALPTTPPPGVSWRAGESGPGPGPRCWTPGVCPAWVSSAASIRRGCPVPGRGWPEGRGPEDACGRTQQTARAGFGSGRGGFCLPDAVAPRSAPGARGQVPRPGSVGKMATPGMSWQQQYYGGSAAGAAKFAPSPAAAQQAGHSMDYSQDLHLKMSKKIAQLTKVRARQRGRHGGDPVRATPASAAGLGGCAPSARGELKGAALGKLQPETKLQEPSDFGGTLEVLI